MALLRVEKFSRSSPRGWWNQPPQLNSSVEISIETIKKILILLSICRSVPRFHRIVEYWYAPNAFAAINVIDKTLWKNQNGSFMRFYLKNGTRPLREVKKRIIPTKTAKVIDPKIESVDLTRFTAHRNEKALSRAFTSTHESVHPGNRDSETKSGLGKKSTYTRIRA